MHQIFVFLPCYNESGNIGTLIEEWLALDDTLKDAGYKLNVCGIDDKSTDDTKAIIASYAAKDKRVRLLAHKKNMNLGGGLRTAFCWFDMNGTDGDLCVVMDGDNTQDPVYITSMLKKISLGADCVIASRYQKGAEVHGVPAHRLLLSDGARAFYTLLLHVPNVRDYTCGYRVYRYEIIHEARAHYGKRFVEMKTFSCMLEVLYKLYLIGADFDEVPFSLRYDNKQGASKMRILKTVCDSFKTAFRLRCCK